MISRAPSRKRRFICEANTGCASVGLAPMIMITSACFHRIEILRSGRSAEGVLQAIAGGRMTHARAGIHVVVAKGGPNHLLHQIGFFVGAARRRDPADRIAPILCLNALELAGRMCWIASSQLTSRHGSVILARTMGLRMRSRWVA